MHSVKIRTVQGVGDIFWVYQKLAPYVGAIDLTILILRHDEVQCRAIGFVKLLPKVRSVDFEVVSPQAYHQLAQAVIPLERVVGNGGLYACNAALEKGVRLEAMDPGYAPQWGVPMMVPDEPFLGHGYVAAYVSGNKHDSSWNDETWAQFIGDAVIAKRFDQLPMVLLGASYDAARLKRIAELLQRRLSVRVSVVIDLPPADAVRVLRDAVFFIGYQSGLNVLADNYDTPQVMVYFPHLRKMLNSWCKPGHAEHGVFCAFTFDQKPAEILASLSR